MRRWLLSIDDAPVETDFPIEKEADLQCTRSGQLMKEFKDRPVNVSLLITHSHWDHVQGFPFFAPAYNPKNQIDIHGFERRSP